NSTQPGAAVATFQGGGIGTVAAPLTNTVAAGARIEDPLARQTVNVGNSYIGFRGERGLSNDFGGLKAIWQSETATNFDGGKATTNSKNAHLWSYGIKYDSERFYGSVHQEKHYDFFGLSTSINNTSLRDGATAANGTFTSALGSHSTDTATRFSAEYRWGSGRVTFDVAKLEYEETDPILTG